MTFRTIGGCVVLILGANLCTAQAAPLDPQQITLIKDTATSICNTVKDIKGEKTDVQIQGEIKGQLSGLIGRLASAGASGTGSFTRDEFEGLTQDATAIAIAGDRECRERLFDKMFDKITAANSAMPSGTSVKAGDCSIATSGNATGNSVNCGPPQSPPAPKP